MVVRLSEIVTDPLSAIRSSALLCSAEVQGLLRSSHLAYKELYHTAAKHETKLKANNKQQLQPAQPSAERDFLSQHISFILKMSVICSSETFVHIRTTGRYIPEFFFLSLSVLGIAI
jgi:hypothetical protein